ncbi:MAG: putative sugar nucleotidyl transferase [Candidatus Omnitrophota bacterium]
MQICVFEDRKGPEKLYPLTYLRATFELRCGRTTLLDKIISGFKDKKINLWVRDCLIELTKEKFDYPVNDVEALKKDDLLFVSGRLLVDERMEFETKEGIYYARAEATEGGALYSPENIAYIYVKKESLKDLRDPVEHLLALQLPTKEVQVTLIKYPWDLINNNSHQIEFDFKRLGKSSASLPGSVAVVGDKNKIYIGKDVEIYPCSVLEAVHGPVIIEDGAKIFPFSRIEGPAVIGKDAQIFSAKIREGTTIGEMCRVGGEVEESIMHGYSNKYHDGFLGHSYVCEWVNLGALTTNSDLKNDYSSVSVYIGGEFVDSKSTRVGAFIGDHVKTSIGTLFNTGTVVGLMSIVVGGDGVLPKFIPSFCWFLNRKPTKGYGFDMLLETAKKVTSRRGRELTQAQIKLLEFAKELTKEETLALIKKARKE